MIDVREAVTQAHHEEWARVIAALTRRFGDFDIAEEEELDEEDEAVAVAEEAPAETEQAPRPERAERGGDGNRLVLIAGSGIEEAALVLRTGLSQEDVRSVAVSNEGGIKDLTAMALLRRLGWNDVRLVRQPSGDGAILSFVGQGADGLVVDRRGLVDLDAQLAER